MYTIQYFIDAFEKAKKDFSDFIEPLSNEEYSTSPTEGKWGAGEVLSHLLEAGNQYLVRMREGLEKTKVNPNSGSKMESYEPSFFWKKFIYMVSPQSDTPLPTVGKFKPVLNKNLDKDRQLKDFLKLQDDFIEILNQAKTYHISLNNIKFGNPISSIIRMHAAVGFAIIEAHQRRHLGQAKRAIDSLKEKD